MHGLQLVERLTDAEQRATLLEEIADSVAVDMESGMAPVRQRDSVTSTERSPSVRADVPIPHPPDLERHVEHLDLEAVWEHVNPQMLLGKHLGLHGSVERLREKGDDKLRKLEERVDEVKQLCLQGGMHARAVWQFWPARRDGNAIVLMGSAGAEVARWDFPRQHSGAQLCLADYVMAEDHLALFVTSAGSGIRAQVETWRDSGEYLKSHVLAALALETAEAAAEWVHERLRQLWGFPDPETMTARDRFAARYRGKRFSFGYPACPDLDGQEALFRLLEPADIGVSLTEGQMMDPEASVSALVFHHPDAKYFGV
jgi:5-methyltetrahydrofolate--homocysteine methyltransferase